jgi:hypothetical protein
MTVAAKRIRRNAVKTDTTRELVDLKTTLKNISVKNS